jgi:hypothetical protein
MKNNNKRTIVKVFDYRKVLNPILKTKLDHCSKLRIVNITNSGIKLNNSCDIDIKLFSKSFEINQLKNTFIDISLAYESILPIKREKLIDTLLPLKSVEIHPEEKFFKILYSNFKKQY